ncbi:glucuronoxylanase [Flavobacteriaceae bacterium XHP0103]|uniref:glucuronoxylanase n=1 Tax=Marixanthotalea marina TaxID=2844359 RepID=UPI002989E1D9|nr:glucuronoxylanase [Marixanthotalea marina]MBU3822219.1 glucuronoxylanase [Marixanthotalea marina]
MKQLKIHFAYLLALLILSCSSSDSEETNNEVQPPVLKLTTKVNVTTSEQYQLIQGFGGINHPIWRTDLNENERELVFGEGDGKLGFSILRVHVDPDPNLWELELPTAQYAISKGVKVFASPWNAPSQLLDPNSSHARVLPEKYGEYVDHLNAFNTYMEDNGVPLYAISIQNEPDWGEWTRWTSEEMLTFMKENAQDIENKVIAPESFQFRRNFSDPILNDPVAVDNVDIIGGHIYGGGLDPYPLAEQKGKEVWMTEYLMNQNSTSTWSQLSPGTIWNETMDMLSTIHQSMTLNWNAYVWWYIQRYYSFMGDGEQGTSRDQVLKRGYAFSHFSRFVRPGYRRVQAQTTVNKGLNVTAYKGNNKTVIVVINQNISSVNGVGFAVDNVVPSSADLYITSLSKNVEKTDLEEIDGDLLFTLPAKSVATIVITD